VELMNKTAERVARRFQAAQEPLSQDFWMDQDEVRELCPECADRMAQFNIRQVRASTFFAQASEVAGLKTAAKWAAWDKLPKGWTQESLKKMWGTITGDVKHKVTKCIKKMTGKVDDPGAFCASLADRLEGKEWRSR
jgi:hypothetical protein